MVSFNGSARAISTRCLNMVTTVQCQDGGLRIAMIQYYLRPGHLLCILLDVRVQTNKPK